MNEEHSQDWRTSELWQLLDAMRVEPGGAALTFEARLAQENGWGRPYAIAVFHEYKRFLFLGARSCGPVTPSRDVDEAWHLHLAYSRHYWEELCGRILPAPLHHGPTAGGADEQGRYRDQYDHTLRLYRETFGVTPPAEIWPSVKVRFSGRRVRIDPSGYWMVPKRGMALLAAGAGGMMAAACSSAASNGEGGFVAMIVAAILVGIVIASVFMRLGQRSRAEGRARKKGSSSADGGDGGIAHADSKDSSDTNSGEGGEGGCGGGCGGD